MELLVNDRGILLSVNGCQQLVSAASKRWVLKKKFGEMLLANFSEQGIKIRLRPLFPALAERQEEGFSWHADSAVYIVQNKQPGAITITVTGNTSTHTSSVVHGAISDAVVVGRKHSNYTVNSSTGIVQQLSSGDSSFFDIVYHQKGQDNYKKDTIINLLTIQTQLSALPRPAINWERLNQAIYASYWSDSLRNKDGGPDEKKLAVYLAANDKKYHDSVYLLQKLDLLLGAKDLSPYQALVRTVPSHYLHSYAHIFNKLENVYRTDAGSALELILMLHRLHRLDAWFHNGFAQQFMQHEPADSAAAIKEWKARHVGTEEINRILKREEQGHKTAMHLLSLLAQQPDSTLQATVHPLQLWVQAQQAGGNRQQLQQLAERFYQPSVQQRWLGRSARYAMLVSNLLDSAGMPDMATALLDTTITCLAADQHNSGIAEQMRLYMDTRQTLLAQRQLLGHAYYLRYKHTLPYNRQQALQYLTKAAEQAPQGPDENPYVSFYDRTLLGSKADYREELAKEVAASGDPEETLQLLSRMVVFNPMRIKEVKEYFTQHFPGRSFADYFDHTITQSWPAAPGFELNDLKGNKVRLSDFKGKWLLLDFWGTWCRPCREDMPNVDKLAASIAAGNPANSALLSIACNDTDEAVAYFMSSQKYHVPVAMSDGRIPADYAVLGYPSKILVTPGGKMLHIAFSADYTTVLNTYQGIVAGGDAGK